MLLRLLSPASIAALSVLLAGPAAAQKRYDAGASDTEIKIGNIMPYSGPASAYGVAGIIEAAYFRMINDQGGINGRQINFISYDDAYNPAKAVEQARKLVESDEVLVVFNPLGTPSNTAILKYLNMKKVPQLFVGAGGTSFGDHKAYPWTMAWQPPYQSEGRIYAKYILTEKPNAKIAVLYQNDDFGKDVLKGFKDGLGDKSLMIVATEAYEVTEPTIDSRIINLKASGADVFVSVTTPKPAVQAIRKVAAMDWKPLYIQGYASASVGSVLKPAGLDISQGIVSAYYAKDGSDPQWDNDEGMKRFTAFLAKYAPDYSRNDISVIYGYGVAQAMVQVLRQAGDDLTRVNVMKQAENLKDFVPDIVLPGVKLNTSANDHYPIEQLQMMRFNGEKWELFGPVITGEIER
ncbi:branched-chain amino acid ABC transporter substrate-binding protein [Rhodopseudomonas boonkerdii]|uniref:ABC transporter substrate-binding protein n=1 Tax=Rhodopseudomonas boonkerdii TaxID=475937 RepID=UPI001E4FEA4D|nr:ABC transporter substrate-binding protein [Rhodopseudomonas boonkerdii]UGV27867.1 branched-chain amino acid ABC transporter substrate-binding protein [Rhodopseudomonas boonkerdii]